MIRLTGLGTGLWLGALALLCLLFAAPIAAQEEPSEETETSAPGADGVFKAPVLVDGRELFYVRGSSALPAEERAEIVATRIREAALSSDATTVTITTSQTALGTAILADGVVITLVTDADSDLEQMDVPVLTQLQANTIRDAILTYRAERTEEALVGSAMEAAAWTAGFAVFTWLSLWLRRRVRRRAYTLTRRYFAGLETATNAQVQAEAVATLIRYGVNFVLLVVYFLGLYYYLSFVLLAFAETRPIAQLLLKYVTEPVLDVVGGLLSYIPNLITLAVIAAVTLYILKGLRAFFDAVKAGTFHLENFEKHWVDPTFNIVRAIIVLIALVFAFPYIPGSGSAAFQGLTILVGAMLSLGSNSVVGNMIAGLFVIYRRSTSIGDRVQVGEHVGDVIQIKMMETHLKSIKNELISIPNAQLLNSEVVNYSRKIDGSGLLVHSTVGIGYEEPPAKVEAMLIEAARQTKGLKTRPEPFVLCAALADYAVNYQINAYCTRGNSIPQITSDLHRNILDVFHANGVQIMTPSYMADPPDPKIPPRDWDGNLAGKTGD